MTGHDDAVGVLGVTLAVIVSRSWCVSYWSALFTEWFWCKRTELQPPAVSARWHLARLICVPSRLNVIIFLQRKAYNLVAYVTLKWTSAHKNTFIYLSLSQKCMLPSGIAFTSATLERTSSTQAIDPLISYVYLLLSFWCTKKNALPASVWKSE